MSNFQPRSMTLSFDVTIGDTRWSVLERVRYKDGSWTPNPSYPITFRATNKAYIGYERNADGSENCKEDLPAAVAESLRRMATEPQEHLNCLLPCTKDFPG